MSIWSVWLCCRPELFAAKSSDAISTSSRAVLLADDAIRQLTEDTRALHEVKRLRCQAILGAQQIDRAEQELRALARSMPKPLPPSILALQVRIDLARSNFSQAEARLAKIDPDQSSIDLELARLQWMLARDNAKTGKQLDAIEQKFGAFARRRAEAISLATLGENESSTFDPAVVAAQGRDWMRRGDPLRAGQFLYSAAKATSDAEESLKLASEAAAAYVAAKQPGQAATVLSDVAMRGKHLHPHQPIALLQASLLWSKSQEPTGPEKIEETLGVLVDQWPDSQQAVVSRKWLVKIFEATNRRIDAAEVATYFSENSQQNRIRELWVRAARESKAR